MTAIGRYVAGHPGFVRDGVTKEEVEAVTSRTTPNPAFYGLVLVLAILVIAVAIPIMAARAGPSPASES